MFTVEIPVKWKQKDGTPQVTNLIYKMSCYRNSPAMQRVGAPAGDCKGVMLYFKGDVDPQGNLVVGFDNMDPVTDATLQSVVGDVAVIKAGSLQFIFDAAAGTVTRTDSNFPARGVGLCPKR